MTCVTPLAFSAPSAIAGILWVICAAILIHVARNHRFAGKFAFLLTLAAMLWWLFTVAFDLGVPDEACKIAWSLAAWPGITLLPIAWAFFIYDYTLNAREIRGTIRWLFYIGLPGLVGIIALTNSRTQLLYGTDTRLVTEAGQAYVIFDHGPLFYTVAAGLYVFVLSALGVLVFAFLNAKKSIRPFLGVLIVITAAPLSANLAYIGWGVTIYGFDPTPFMFAVALIALSWLIVNNTLMDTAAQGRSLLFHATQDPVILMDAAGRFVGANPAARATFGKSLPGQGGALDQLELIGPILSGVSETGEMTCSEPIRHMGRVFDPRALPIESPVQTRGNLLGWAVSLVDITERERSAEALREALARAEAANQAKSQFLAMISHELRTPVTSVKGGLDLALGGVVGDLSDPMKDLLTIAQRNSLRLIRLIDDVLDLQKLDLSTITLSPGNLDAGDFLREVVEEYTAYADERDVRLVIVSDDPGVTLRADPYRLKQVVGNVISNAVKFSDAGTRVECAADVIGSGLRFSIRDSGIGIPENHEDRVFGRFNQIENSAAHVSGGSGLGMHIAKLLIERMGGAIRYESRLGVGTTFYIDIPLSAQRPVSPDPSGDDGQSDRA